MNIKQIELIARMQDWTKLSADNLCFSLTGDNNNYSMHISGDSAKLSNLLFSAMCKSEKVEQIVKSVAKDFDTNKKKLIQSSKIQNNKY